MFEFVNMILESRAWLVIATAVVGLNVTAVVWAIGYQCKEHLRWY
jgi:hypothetical protein